MSNRSAYLQKLLSEAQQRDVEAVKVAGKSVYDGVRTYALLEELRRDRDDTAFSAVYAAIDESADGSLSTDDKALLRETIREISNCPLQAADALAQWRVKNPTVTFEKDKFKLKGETCS